MNLVDKKDSKHTKEPGILTTNSFFCGRKDEPKNLHKCQMLELHNRVKNTIQNLNDLNLIATLSEGDMKTIDFIIPTTEKNKPYSL